MAEKRYLTMLAISCGGFLLFFLVLSTRMEAFSGSATRLGGFLERDYGWNIPQRHFDKPLFERLASLNDYVRPVDVIVIGDSFSEDQHKGWVNYLAYANGLSAVFFHVDRISPAGLLAHPIFRSSPPNYLLYTSNEGLSYLRFARLSSLPASSLSTFRGGKRPSAGTGAAPQRPPPLRDTTHAYQREKSMSFRTRMAATGDFVVKTFQRAIFSERNLRVNVISIDCESCFSNAKRGHFLAMSSTIAPIPYAAEYRRAAIAGLETFKRLVESNGVTKFATIVFPSKATVYLPYLRNKNDRTMFASELISSNSGFVSLLPGLREAVASDLTDVYLPNDHHMGSAGYAITAEIVAAAVGLAGPQPR